MVGGHVRLPADRLDLVSTRPRGVPSAPTAPPAPRRDTCRGGGASGCLERRGHPRRPAGDAVPAALVLHRAVQPGRLAGPAGHHRAGHVAGPRLPRRRTTPWAACWSSSCCRPSCSARSPGAFADRFDRRRTMVVTDALRFVLFLTIPLAHLVVDSRQTLAWLYVANFLIQCLSLFWMPAKDASVPNLVRRDQIEAANQLSLITTYGLTPVLGAGAVLGAVADHQGARPAPGLLPGPAGQPGAVLQRRRRSCSARSSSTSSARSAATARASGPTNSPACSTCCARARRSSSHSRLVGGLIIGLVGAFAAGGAVIGAGKTFVTQPRRRQRGLRRAVRLGVRRARLRHGVRAADRPRAVASAAVRPGHRVRRRCA